MSYDLLEKDDDEALQKDKEAFGDFVVNLEEKLDMAEEYGKAGDMKMLSILSELNGVEDDLAELAKKANEQMPSRNYHVEVTKIIREYITLIIEKEYRAIEDILQSGEEAKQEATVRGNQLLHIISFYGGLYPEIDLAQWKEKTERLIQ